MSNLIFKNQTLENVKMVIFDKDGTLIDIHHYWCSMIEFRARFFVDSLSDESIDHNALYNDLVDRMGINLRTKKMKPEGPVGIKPRNIIQQIALETLLQYTEAYNKEMVADIFEKVDQFSKNELTRIVKPLKGVEEFLLQLNNAGVLCAIATTDLSTRANLAMQSLEMEHFFCDIAGADLVTNSKPSPDLIHYLLHRHQVAPDNAVVVGDSIVDLEMAEQAGCRFIGVTTGLYTDVFMAKSSILMETLSEIGVEA
jgi:phosphoglycolate phosphatase